MIETGTPGRDSKNTYRPHVATSETTLNPQNLLSFLGGTTSYFVLQLIYGFSFWIHHFVISDLMCKFLTWACLSLQRFQMKALGHGYTMNPQPPSKKHLVKGGGGKQTSLTSTKVHKWQN